MKVPQRDAGREGARVPLFSLGSWYTYNRMDFDEVVALLASAIEHGVNLFDIGVYGRYPQKFPLGNPRAGRIWTDVIFSRAIQEVGVAREDYQVAEKIWMWAYPQISIETQLDHALLRLGSDYADFIILGDMERQYDFDRLVAEVGALVATGKARAWGVNNWSAAELRTVHDIAVREGLPRPALAQLKYNVSRREKAEGAAWQALFADTGIGLQASDVFESGYLAGRSELDRGVARDPGDIQPLIRAASPRFTELAAQFDATPAQLAIAFCLGHPHLSNVLFGCSSKAQFEQNLGALRVHEQYGAQLGAKLEPFWFDRGRVDPQASWAAKPLRYDEQGMAEL